MNLVSGTKFVEHSRSGVIWLVSFFAPGGWTSFPPLSSMALYNGTKTGQSLWCVAIFVNGLSSIRCPGMTLFRMPMSIWSLFVTAFLVLLAVPVLSAAVSMVWLDLNMGTAFSAGKTARAAIHCCTSPLLALWPPVCADAACGAAPAFTRLTLLDEVLPGVNQGYPDGLIGSGGNEENSRRL